MRRAALDTLLSLYEGRTTHWPALCRVWPPCSRAAAGSIGAVIQVLAVPGLAWVAEPMKRLDAQALASAALAPVRMQKLNCAQWEIGELNAMRAEAT